MRIQNIEITNYKAFLGTHKINVGGKNLFIYGENGSGKSSLYYALKNFFQSSIEYIDLAELENIFVSVKKQGKTAIKVTFKPNGQGQNKQKSYHFKHNIDLLLRFSQLRPDDGYTQIEGAEVHVDLTYAGKPVSQPHLFMNEARLSAIAISIYLGMIKRHVQGIPCKVLFLDDIFIGLDIANRLPMLKILESKFPDYQVFITTYDKPWFEYAQSFLEGSSGWKTLEFYAQPCKEEFEVPVIFDNQDLIVKAEKHLQQCDYKAAAVYTRSAFEKIIRKHCEKKKKPVAFKSHLKKYSTENFWAVIKNDVPKTIKADIEKYRALVLNPFSHYNTEWHEIKTELTSAIQVVKNLKTKLGKL